MGIVNIKDVRESNALKQKMCANCIEQLKGVLDDEQLEKFEESLKRAVGKVVLKEKRS